MNSNGKRPAVEEDPIAMKKSQPSSPVGGSFTSNNSFPEDLQVTILLSSEDITIPASTLVHHSSWFAEKLQTSFKPLGGSKNIHLSIDQEFQKTVPMLRYSDPDSQSSEDSIESSPEINENTRSDGPATPSIKIKAEPGIKVEGTPGNANNILQSKELTETAYALLFDAYLGKRVQFPRNANQAFDICIQLCRLAEAYGSLRLINPLVRAVLFEHTNSLFTAIAVDPPAWVQFGIQLKSKSIFREALIHLCGAAPAWPFLSPPDVIPDSIHKTINDKSQRLQMRVLRTVQDILRNTIMVEVEEGGPKKAASLTRSPDSWILVQHFRSYLIERLRQLRVPDSGEEVFSSLEPTRIGIFLRRLRQGGDSYLPISQVMNEINEAGLNGFVQWDAAADDIKSLKSYASRTVQPICANKLMLPVDETKIGYLTCVDITDEDLPWTHDN